MVGCVGSTCTLWRNFIFLMQHRGSSTICKHHLFLSWKECSYLPEIRKNSKNLGFSNWMSAVEETSSKHIKSVVILSLNTLFFILILKQRYLQFFVVILKNVENNLKRESWHKLFSLLKKKKKKHIHIHTQAPKTFG